MNTFIKDVCRPDTEMFVIFLLMHLINRIITISCLSMYVRKYNEESNIDKTDMRIDLKNQIRIKKT